jgi:hypothetical protein
MLAGNGFTDRSLTSDEIRQIVSTAAAELQIDGRRVLIIIPDGTRTMPMPLMFEILQQERAPGPRLRHSWHSARIRPARWATRHSSASQSSMALAGPPSS